VGEFQDGDIDERCINLDADYQIDKYYIVLLWNTRLAVIVRVLLCLWKNCFLSWHYKFILAKMA